MSSHGQLLALDMSTTATGYALFDISSKKLLTYGLIKPTVKIQRTCGYPVAPLLKMRDIADQLKELLVAHPEVSLIAIEEVNQGISRLGQKTLCGVHWIVLDRLEKWLPIITFKDSDASEGWRTDLKLILSELDKSENKKNKDLNKKLPKGIPKYPIITKKHLACRYVNAKYGLSLDCEQRAADADLADSIGLGTAILLRIGDF